MSLYSSIALSYFATFASYSFLITVDLSSFFSASPDILISFSLSCASSLSFSFTRRSFSAANSLSSAESLISLSASNDLTLLSLCSTNRFAFSIFSFSFLALSIFWYSSPRFSFSHFFASYPSGISLAMSSIKDFLFRISLLTS